MATTATPKTETPAAAAPVDPRLNPSEDQKRRGISIHPLRLTEGDNTPKKWVGHVTPVEDASTAAEAIRLKHFTSEAVIMEAANAYRHVQQNRAKRDAAMDPAATSQTIDAAVLAVVVGERAKGTRSGANAAAQQKAVKLDALTQRAKNSVLAGDLKKVASLIEYGAITQEQVDEWLAEAKASKQGGR